MNDLVRFYADLNRVEGFLVALLRNLGFGGLLAVADRGTVEVIVVHLKQIVVVGVGVVDDPLQPVTFLKLRGEYKSARGRRDSVEYEIAAPANVNTLFLGPTQRVVPFGHAVGSSQIDGARLASCKIDGRCTDDAVGSPHCEGVRTHGQGQRAAARYLC